MNQGPEPKFTSRYADPTHPAASGDLFGLVTGGLITRGNGKEKIRGFKANFGRANSNYPSEYPNEYHRRSSSSSNPPAPYAPYGRRRPGLVEALVDAGKSRLSESTQGRRPAGRREKRGLLAQGKKLYEQKVLYLVIVDMPSDEDMAQARADLGLSA